MGEPLQIRTQTQYQTQTEAQNQTQSHSHPHLDTNAAAAALQPLPTRPGQSPTSDGTSQTTRNSSKIPFRPQKIRKLSPDAPSDASSSDTKPPKPIRVYKDPGKSKKRNASHSTRVFLAKPLSCEGETDLALRHLQNTDPLLASLIDAHPLPEFDSFQPPFLALTKSIIFQQLAYKAGNAIYERFLSLCGGEEGVVPEIVLALSSNQLRQMGISGRKATYIYDLASKYKNGILSDSSILEMDDRSLFTMLNMVKGIGSWSVHMFMIFSLHRPDVLPVNDVGVRKGVQLLYGLEELPRPSQMEQLCEKWRPYRSVASWYMWRFVEAKGAQTATALVDRTVQHQQQLQEPQQHQHQHQHHQPHQHQQQQQLHQRQQQHNQHQHQLQLLDPINGIANFGACIWGQ
ncbi:uncharacterized protein LOC131164930 [Malania oleifera]|uniref:uncharacterized protein LOC131164930 n=1 Tax=Malania oleifera TaxID=397392 RepID=UPI0025ADA99B|nr:uncharacterized protein LOC131164930 [Malania oleifera]